jgi:hypothetical protein
MISVSRKLGGICEVHGLGAEISYNVLYNQVA